MPKFQPEEIKKSNDLVTIAELAGARLHKIGKIWKGSCPLHHGKNPGGFNIYPTSDGMRWKCFTDDCGGGDVISFVMVWQNLDFQGACRYLSGECGIDTEKMEYLARQREKEAAREMEISNERAKTVLEDLRSAQHWLVYNSNLEKYPDIVAYWNHEGIPTDWQYIWKLGYSPSFRYWADIETPTDKVKKECFSPTLTIPIFGHGWECFNIRHRLLNPQTPADKYRPEYFGIPAKPFIADPDIPIGEGKILVICEGEKKAMVTYIALDMPGIQVIGIPGKRIDSLEIARYAANVDQIQVCYDPDGTKYAERVALSIGDRARVIDLPMKIDDMIVNYGMDQKTILGLFKQSRKPRRPDDDQMHNKNACKKI